MDDKFIDERIPQARMARAMARQFNQVQESLADLKASHKVSEFMEQEDRKGQIESEMKKVLVVSDKIEDELIELCEGLVNTRFLSAQELAMLPKRVLETLGVDIDAESDSDKEADNEGGDF